MHKNNRQNRLPCVWDNKGNMENLMFDDNADPVAIDSMISCFDPKGSGACQLETFAQQAEQANSPLRTHIRALVLAVVVFWFVFPFLKRIQSHLLSMNSGLLSLCTRQHTPQVRLHHVCSQNLQCPPPLHTTLAHSHSHTHSLHSPRGRRRG